MKKQSVLIFLFLFAFVPLVAMQGVAGDKHNLKSVSCSPECGFMVRSHDEKELAAIVIEHAKTQHNKAITEKDVKGMTKTEHVSGLRSNHAAFTLSRHRADCGELRYPSTSRLPVICVKSYRRDRDCGCNIMDRHRLVVEKPHRLIHAADTDPFGKHRQRCFQGAARQEHLFILIPRKAEPDQHRSLIFRTKGLYPLDRTLDGLVIHAEDNVHVRMPRQYLLRELARTFHACFAVDAFSENGVRQHRP